MTAAENEKLAEAVLELMRQPTVKLSKTRDGNWSMSGEKPNGRKPAPVITSGQLSALVAAEWIIKSGEGEFSLGPAGRAWLARRKGGSDPFRRQHQERAFKPVKTPDGIDLELEVDISESPLSWLRARKDKCGNPMISSEQFRAGEKLRRDFTLAGMTGRVTATWSASAPPRRRKRHGARMNAAADVSDDAIAAKERFFRAIDAMGPELAGVLVEVCCYLNGIEAAEKKFGWPRRSGKTVLQIALSTLARHYGLLRAPRYVGKNEHWGTEGYGPAMFAPTAGPD